MHYFFIVGCIFFTICAQLLMKKGTLALTPGFAEGQSLMALFLNGYIFFGLFSGGLGAVCWIKALQHFDLSYAYPFTSLTFIGVIILSGMLFGETIKWNQWMGLLFVIAGLYIGSR